MQTEHPNPKQLLQKHRNDLVKGLAENRAASISAHRDLEDFGVKDDYITSLPLVLQRLGNTATLPEIQEVFADQAALREAREALKKEGVITEEKGKPTRIRLLSPIAQESGVASASSHTPASPSESEPPVQNADASH